MLFRSHAGLTPILDGTEMPVHHWTHSSGRAFRDRDMVKDGDSHFALVCGTRTTIEFAHHGGELRLVRGEVTALHTSLPASIGSSRTFEYLSILVPEAAVYPLAVEAGQLIGRRWNRSSVSLTLLTSYLACLQRQPPRAGAVRQAAARHVQELVRLAFAEELQREIAPTDPSVASARLAIALATIAERF